MYRRLCLPKVSIWVIIFIMMIISTCISGQTFTFVRQRPVDYIGKPLVMKCTVDGKNGVLLWVRNGITVGEDADPYNKTLYSGTVAGETYKLNINFLSRSAEENVEWYCVNNGKESTRINITEATISAVMDTTLKRNDILNLTKQDVKDNFHSEIVTSCSNPVATVTWKYADVDKPNVMKNVTFGVNTTGITSCGNCEAGEVCTRSTLDLPVSRLGGHKVLLSVEIVHPSLDTPLVFSSPAEITFLSQKDDTIVWALALAVVSGILCAAVIAVIVVVVVISASALVKKYLVITVIVLGSVCCVIGLVIAVLLGRSDDGSHERPEWVAAAVFCALDFIAGISGIIFGYLKLKGYLEFSIRIGICSGRESTGKPPDKKPGPGKPPDKKPGPGKPPDKTPGPGKPPDKTPGPGKPASGRIASRLQQPEVENSSPTGYPQSSEMWKLSTSPNAGSSISQRREVPQPRNRPLPLPHSNSELTGNINTSMSPLPLQGSVLPPSRLPPVDSIDETEGVKKKKKRRKKKPAVQGEDDNTDTARSQPENEED